VLLAGIEVWALPLNTFLLIGLALVNAYIARQQRGERRDLTDVKRSIGLDRRWTDGAKTEKQDTGERRRVTDRRGGVVTDRRRGDS
jgi:hypothetical protein